MDGSSSAADVDQYIMEQVSEGYASPALMMHDTNSHGRNQLRPSNYTDLHPHPESTTFVNRPFPLIEADAHFARLEACGLSFILFIVT